MWKGGKGREGEKNPVGSPITLLRHMRHVKKFQIWFKYKLVHVVSTVDDLLAHSLPTHFYIFPLKSAEENHRYKQMYISYHSWEWSFLRDLQSQRIALLVFRHAQIELFSVLQQRFKVQIIMLKCRRYSQHLPVNFQIILVKNKGMLADKPSFCFHFFRARPSFRIKMSGSNPIP